MHKTAIHLAIGALLCVWLADMLLKAARACSTLGGLYMIDQQSGASWCISYQALGGGLLLLALLLVAVGVALTFCKGE